MVDFIKFLVKIIKLFVFLDNVTAGGVTQTLKELEEKYGISL